MSVCPQCRGAGIYYAGVGARISVRCECKIEERRRNTLVVGGFAAADADLTAADAVAAAGRPPESAASYRKVAVYLTTPEPPPPLRFIYLPFWTVNPEPLVRYFAAAYALTRPVKLVTPRTLVDAFFKSGPPPALTPETAVFVPLTHDAKNSMLAPRTFEFLQRRYADGACTVVYEMTGSYNVEAIYGLDVVGFRAKATAL